MRIVRLSEKQGARSSEDYGQAVLTSHLLPSIVPNLRAHCLHVHISLQLLHDRILQDHHGRPPDCHICWHDNVCLCVRRVLDGHCVGEVER